MRRVFGPGAATLSFGVSAAIAGHVKSRGYSNTSSARRGSSWLTSANTKRTPTSTAIAPIAKGVQRLGAVLDICTVIPPKADALTTSTDVERRRDYAPEMVTETHGLEMLSNKEIAIFWQAALLRG
jgi:hypothetical protein